MSVDELAAVSFTIGGLFGVAFFLPFLRLDRPEGKPREADDRVPYWLEMNLRVSLLSETEETR